MAPCMGGSPGRAGPLEPCMAPPGVSPARYASLLINSVWLYLTCKLFLLLFFFVLFCFVLFCFVLFYASGSSQFSSAAAKLAVASNCCFNVARKSWNSVRNCSTSLFKVPRSSPNSLRYVDTWLSSLCRQS